MFGKKSRPIERRKRGQAWCSCGYRKRGPAHEEGRHHSHIKTPHPKRRKS